MSNKNEKVVEAEVIEVSGENVGETPVQPTVNEKKNEKKSLTRKLGEWLIAKNDLHEQKRADAKAEKEKAKAEGRLTKGQKIGLGLGIGAGILGTIVAKEFVRAAMSTTDEEEETNLLTEGEDVSNEIVDEIGDNNE